MRLAAAALLIVWGAVPALAQCDTATADLRGAFGAARFSVELADTPDERAQGLMNRETLPRGAGMLFVYDPPQPAAFWMKNTLIPLDMIFADAAGRVVRVHSNAVPLDETPIVSGSDVVMVLEINGGLADRLGIAAGAELRHPALDQDLAVWPCAAP